MGNQDARSLPAEDQEDLRRRVVEAVQKGLSQTEVARVFGLARDTVSRWMGMVERDGALKAQRRGRPAVARLAPHQAATTVRHILRGCPDQLSLPFALWTREAVQELLTSDMPPVEKCHQFSARSNNISEAARFASLQSAKKFRHRYFTPDSAPGTAYTPLV